MKLEMFTGGSVATNGYLLQNEDCTLLVDAPEGVFDWLQEKGISPDYLLLTHQHFDHVEDASKFEAPIYAHSPYSSELTLADRARSWGMAIEVLPFEVSRTLAQEQSLTLGSFEFSLFHVPGHSPDSLVYYLPAHELALAGDTLFRQGVGRTDLPGGDHDLLFEGIREKLLTLPPQTKILPGHGPDTTPEAEKRFL